VGVKIEDPVLITAAGRTAVGRCRVRVENGLTLESPTDAVDASAEATGLAGCTRNRFLSCSRTITSSAEDLEELRRGKVTARS